MPRRQFSDSMFDTINVAPLVDTLFFLLIIFMVTAPLIEYSTDVSAPEMNADTLPQDDEHAKVVNLKKDGLVLFNNQNMSQEDFFQQLPELKQDPEVKLYLRADRMLSYGNVIDFLARIRRNGFANVFLVTTEETE